MFLPGQHLLGCAVRVHTRAALPHPLHTRDADSCLEHPVLGQGSLRLCEEPGEGDFSAKAGFAAALQGAGRGGFSSPSLLTRTGVTAGGGSAKGEMCQPQSDGWYAFNPPTFLVSPGEKIQCSEPFALAVKLEGVGGVPCRPPILSPEAPAPPGAKRSWRQS